MPRAPNTYHTPTASSPVQCGAQGTPRPISAMTARVSYGCNSYGQILGMVGEPGVIAPSGRGQVRVKESEGHSEKPGLVLVQTTFPILLPRFSSNGSINTSEAALGALWGDGISS